MAIEYVPRACPLKFLDRIYQGSNASTLSNKNPENKRRDLIILATLVKFPGVGLILYETGWVEDPEVVCETSFYI